VTTPPPLRIVIVTPSKRGSTSGNRVTAERWARLLRSLGHRVRVAPRWTDERADILVAIHAVKSASSISRFAAAHPERPIVVLLAGTDLQDARRAATLRRSVALARRVVVLQPLAMTALERIAPGSRRKARVILQSAVTPPRRSPVRGSASAFEVAVIGHLRAVKDPFRAARAAAKLPASSRVVILHAGAALTPGMARRARAEMRRNPRYRWLGAIPRARALALLARCRLLILSSRSEGGANVISEAAVAGLPILSSRVDGSAGLLGSRHPGYFPVGDTQALAELLHRSETEPSFLAGVGRSSLKLAHSLTPARERAAWKTLLEELT
jgi:putative glycosyltransferase (TIGR04348 family)